MINIHRHDLGKPWEKFGFDVFERETNEQVFHGEYSEKIYNREILRENLQAKFPKENFRIETLDFNKDNPRHD